MRKVQDIKSVQVIQCRGDFCRIEFGNGFREPLWAEVHEGIQEDYKYAPPPGTKSMIMYKFGEPVRCLGLR